MASGWRRSWWWHKVVAEGHPLGVKGSITSRAEKVDPPLSGGLPLVMSLLLMSVGRGVLTKLSPTDGGPLEAVLQLGPRRGTFEIGHVGEAH